MTPEELETLPKELEKLFSRLETQVMQEVVERIKLSGELIPSVQYRLERLEALGVSRRNIQETIDAALKEANIKVDKAYAQAAESDTIRYQSIYKAAGKEFLPYAENRWLQEIVQVIRAQTKETLVNITGTTGFQVDLGGRKVFTPLSEYLQRSLDAAVLGITAGTVDYNTAIKKVIDEMTMSGLRTVDYASGHSDRVEVAARRAIMTGTSQMMDKMNARYAAELETDYWEVDWHGGARNTGTGYRNHQSWQGRVYSSEEMVSICGLGEALGFAGINCYHIRFPFIPDVSVRQYTDEWLAEQNQRENAKRTYAGKEYDTYAATQYQRKLERTLRKQKQDIKLMEHADVDPDDITLAKARYQAISHTYTQFSKAMDLPQQKERLYTGSVKADKIKMTTNLRHGKITEEDQFFINEMISFKSYGINEKLRSQESLTPEEHEFIRGVDQAIMKLPEYHGTVYRSVDAQRIYDMNQFDEEHQPGKLVVYHAYTSASLEVYDADMTYQFVILSKHGKDMTAYNPQEKEIIFKRDSVFVVTKREENTFYLEEI